MILTRSDNDTHQIRQWFSPDLTMILTRSDNVSYQIWQSFSPDLTIILTRSDNRSHQIWQWFSPDLTMILTRSDHVSPQIWQCFTTNAIWWMRGRPIEKNYTINVKVWMSCGQIRYEYRYMLKFKTFLHHRTFPTHVVSYTHILVHSILEESCRAKQEDWTTVQWDTFPLFFSHH